MTAYRKQNLDRYIEELRDKAKRISDQLLLIAHAADGAGYITCVAMADDILALFVGDIVSSKYGDELVIESFDPIKEEIHFVGGKVLQDHRISYVLERGQIAKNILNCINK